MSRIAKTFADLAGQGRKALIPYLTAGDPEPGITVGIMHAMADAGADIVELGIPFSDPMADGPVIQRAGERALKHGVGLPHVLEMVRVFRGRNDKTPVVLMGYANPIEAMGAVEFTKLAGAAGVDGVIVVDYPPEECSEFADLLRGRGMDLIFLLAPTTTSARMAAVAQLATGYIYYVSLTGITGASHLDLSDVAANVRRIRGATGLPVGVGFGIRDGATARAICKFADAAIIGSSLIQELEMALPGQEQARVAAFVRSVREAMDAKQ
ncbi:MAG: tryptophan synthase subunit alpha [Betaproteobacteria bacterium]|nr:tryptophan synthase subunit alpha [Betaproteobacteria bacterium]